MGTQLSAMAWTRCGCDPPCSEVSMHAPEALLSVEIMHHYVRSEMEECIHVEVRMVNINPELFTFISLQRRRGS